MQHHPGNLAADRHDVGEQLLVRFARRPDPGLHRRIVERYLPLARFAASDYTRSSEPFDDLLQVASIGLLKAIERYDPRRGAAFSSYALPTMHGELRRHLRDRSWAVRPPRGLQENALRVAKVSDALEQRDRRSPTVTDVAAAAGMSSEDVLEARQALAARHACSLSVAGSSDEGELEIDRRHGVLEAGYAGAEVRATLDVLASGALTRRERQIVRLRFEADLTQAEIGAIVGLSQMHVSRLLRCAIDKLRNAASEVDVVEAC